MAMYINRTAKQPGRKTSRIKIPTGKRIVCHMSEIFAVYILAMVLWKRLELLKYTSRKIQQKKYDVPNGKRIICHMTGMYAVYILV